MKSNRVWMAVLGGLGFALAAGTVLAAEPVAKDDQALGAERQKRMLERYGDEGIDANGDGVLMRSEVQAFFAERDDRPPRGPGRRGGRAGDRPQRGPGRGAGPGQVFMLLNQLELLNSETVPAGVTAAGLPHADTDDDGVLSDAEWQAFATQRSTRIVGHVLKQYPNADADKDGTLSAEELATFKAAETEKAKAIILIRDADADSDGDGVLSDAEFEAFTSAQQARNRARMLERNPQADLDGDGVISETEAAAFMLQRPQRGPGDRAGRGDRPGRGPGKGRARGAGRGARDGAGRGPGRPDRPNAPVDDVDEE